MTLAALIAIFFVLILIGAPVAVALGASAIVTSMIFAPIPPEIVGQKVLANLTHFTLMAVPFFFFAAALMETGGLVRRLVGFANSLIGHHRGGLGMTAVLSSTLFAAISGSSPATVAAVGRVMYPNLVEAGYSPRYAIGSLAVAGSLGILIPPSIPMILYGFLTETSITRLFLAGIIPGLIYGGLLMVMAYLLARRNNTPVRAKASWGERGRTFRSAAPALLLPVVIFVGIYGIPSIDLFGIEIEGGGIFTPTEAAIIAAMLALLVGLFVYRETTLPKVAHTVMETAPTVGMIFFITTNALLFSFFITQLGVPAAVGKALVAMDMPQWLFLLLVNLLLIVVGLFLEGVPTILMLIPVLFPAAVSLGVDPIHFCIVVIVNIELGLVTPPVGLNLFVGSAVSRLELVEVFRAVVPWSCVTLVVLVLITYVPELSLFLPRLVMG